MSFKTSFNGISRHALGIAFSTSFGLLLVNILVKYLFPAPTALPFVILIGICVTAVSASIISGLSFNVYSVTIGVIIGSAVAFMGGQLFFYIFSSAAVSSLVGAVVPDKKIRNINFARNFHVFILLLIALSIVISLWDRALRLPIVVLTISSFLLWQLSGGCPFNDFEISLRKEKGRSYKQLQGGLISFILKDYFGFNASTRQVERGLYMIAITLFSWYTVSTFIR